MGCGTSFACHDCKKLYNLGYGSYGTWSSARTLADWNAEILRRPQIAQLRKNQNLLQCLTEHDGHHTTQWIDDFEWGNENNTLYGMGSYGTRGAPILEDCNSYEYINLFEDPPELKPPPLPPLPERGHTTVIGGVEWLVTDAGNWVRTDRQIK